ncbi:MAG: MBL fold metallo-hydrolase [Deltaproteobacteria bacterium]|nr:MBL fold metallo-hydrolase [Deltaproteobacteria bacterium]
MLIRTWGSRGSIPVSGREYLKYGGDTSCVEVVTDAGDLIIIDAGTGLRRLGSRCVAEGISRINLLITHSHWDHLCGFPFFRPLYRKGSDIRVMGPRTGQGSLKKIISKTMSHPFFPVELKDIRARIRFISTGTRAFEIGGVRIKGIPLNHTNRGVGYRLEEGGRSFVFLTDNELGHRHPHGRGYDDYVRFAEGAEVLFHDAEFTPGDYARVKGWGHSVYLDSLRLALDAGVKKLGLFHHNQDRTDKEIDGIVRECRGIIAKRRSRLKCFAVATGTEIKI